MPLDRPATPTQEAKMYNHDGHDLFVIDGHMHFWDANPENWRNKYGESWIKCFYAYHSGLSPADGPCCTDRQLGGEDWTVYEGPVPDHPGQPPCRSKRTKLAVITSRSSGTE